MVSSNKGSNERAVSWTYWVRLAIVCVAAPASADALAQDTLVPSWRSGVSRWNGSGYTGSTSITVSSAPAAPATAISEAPYTIPVDPAKLPATNKISVSGQTPTANPYFGPPESDDASSLELTSPSDAPEPPSRVGITLPNDFNPTTPLPASLPAPLPSAQSVSNGVTPSADRSIAAPLSAEPIDRLEEQEPILPPPEAIPPPLSDEQELETIRDQIQDSESITERIAEEVVGESAPLEEEVIRWYQYPWRWMRGWNSHAELGLDGSTGNARTLAIQTGLETKRQTDLYTVALDFDYRQASNRSTTTEDNGRFNLDYDRLLADTPWSGFAKYGMEWDKFKAFDLRVWVNGGVGYYWVRRDDANFVTRFGAGASQEIGAPDDDWIPEAVFGAEADRQVTSRQKVKGKIDYFPAWNDFGNFRLVSDVAWEILLDDSDNLSLKLAATDRYDSTPQGAKKNDLYYSLLLLYKF